MRQLVYFSTATVRQSKDLIEQVLEVSRRRNDEEGVTGLLIAGGNRYLQVLEGDAAVVEAVMARIERDPRHCRIHILVDRAIKKRDFANWTMAFLDEPKLGTYASFQTLADAMHAMVDDRLKDRVAAFARAFAITPMAEADSPWPLAADVKR
jgi:hypothetical protein